MGTQQILLIVLSVIIVGVAVAVGIQMMNSQAVNSNRSAVKSDLQILGTSIMQYYREPSNTGGAGGSILNGTEETLYKHMGWDSNPDTTATGVFTLDITGTNVVEIVGVGTEIGIDGTNPVGATLTISCAVKDPSQTVQDN